MTSSLRITVALLLAYLLIWTVCFAVVFVLGGEMVPWDSYLTYFMLAWTFRAGEMPTFIWWSSFIVFVPTAVLVFMATSRVRRAN